MLPVPNISIRGGGFVMSDLEKDVKKTLDLRGLNKSEVNMSYMDMDQISVTTYRRASDEQRLTSRDQHGTGVPNAFVF